MFYLRFLDDIIGAWTHGEGAFQQFVHILNTHHPSIKLKQEHSDVEISFLDTTAFFEEGMEGKRLHTKVYFKPTDTHALLHKSSYHPPHTFWGLVKSQIFHRICSKKEDSDNARRVFRETLSVLRTRAQRVIPGREGMIWESEGMLGGILNGGLLLIQAPPRMKREGRVSYLLLVRFMISIHLFLAAFSRTCVKCEPEDVHLRRG